jgi:hypothetical protein
MSTASYDDRTTVYGQGEGEAHREVRTERAPIGGGLIFLWVAWLLAGAFWLFSFGIDVGILKAVQHPFAQVNGSAGASGVGWMLIDVVGVLVVGLALLYGLARYTTRNRRNDPVTEATTAALYDQAGDEPDGGTSRSPRAESPEQRAINRGVQPPID